MPDDTPALPSGYTLDSAAPPLPAGYTADAGASQQPSTYSKLTASYNPKVEDWAKDHPVLGPVMRFLDSTGGAFIGAPEAIGRFANDIANHHGQQTAEQIADSLHEWFTNPNVRKSAASLAPEALGQGTGSVAGSEALGAGAAKLGDLTGAKVPPLLDSAQRKLAETVYDPKTGKVLTPYELAVKKFIPNPYEPQATPAKAIPKGTNYGQYLEDQKAAAKAAAAQQSADASNPAGTPLQPGGKIVDPNSAPQPINKTYVSYPRLKLAAMARHGDVAALRELVRSPEKIDIDAAVPNWRFMLEPNRPGVVYGGPEE